MFRRLCVVVFLLVGGLTPLEAQSKSIPTPEANFLTTLIPRPCAWDNSDPYERDFYEQEGWSGPSYERYPGRCQRLKFAYGPIVVKPGQNDQLISPVTIEKPWQDGYVTRFKPDLVRADGRSHRSNRSTSTTARGSRIRATARPVLRGRRGEDDRPVPEGATACRSRRPTNGYSSTWSTRRYRRRWRCSSPMRSTSSRNRRPRR